MPYYDVCPLCGATLDPGEKCDCHTERKARTNREKRRSDSTTYRNAKKQQEPKPTHKYSVPHSARLRNRKEQYIMEISEIKTIRDHSTIGDYYKAMEIFNSLKAIEKETLFAIAALYAIGIAEGKRMERARRRRVTA